MLNQKSGARVSFILTPSPSEASRKTRKLGHAPPERHGLDGRQLGSGQPAIYACTEISQASLFQESIPLLSSRERKRHLSGALSFICEALAKGNFVHIPLTFHGSLLADLVVRSTGRLAFARPGLEHRFENDDR
jgi:hypothetical protein